MKYDGKVRTGAACHEIMAMLSYLSDKPIISRFLISGIKHIFGFFF